MTAGAPLKGACLCGACSFTATPMNDGANVCHCEMCRKWSAGMYMSVYCQDIVFDDETHVGRFQASDWGERVFCKQCGSSLIWQMRDGSGAGVSLHSFDEPSAFTLKNQWFIDKKPDTYALTNETVSLTEAECIANFAPETDLT